MRRALIVVFLLLLSSCEVKDRHTLYDGALRQIVARQFEVQKQVALNRSAALFAVLESDLTGDERDALHWLYAWMPLSDLADYDGLFYLRQVRATLQARQEMPWGASLPQDLFLHFVLPLRVNNENLDSARTVFYRLLKSRVAGLTLRQAALEVNHWCHEHVTYRGSDSRTSSPLATMKNALGRCGEESVFTVSALRAVGIPARQVYVPRWAHTDDNHAWVEVWVDGRWCFLGACEPDPDLDMGWFKEAARRAMLVHTRVMGPYVGPEELLDVSPRHREINVLSRYAQVKPLVVQTVAKEGLPVKDALVSFGLYNYGEFYPLAKRRTDADGCCSLQTGFGDLMIWAQYHDLAGYCKAQVAAKDTVILRLDSFPVQDHIVDLDFSPPISLPALDDTIPSHADEPHRMRLRHEDSLRAAYEATFMDSCRAARLARDLDLPADTLWTFLSASRGNHQEISRFIHDVPEHHRRLLWPMLRVLSEKDIRDAKADVLLDHLVTAAKTAVVEHDPDFYSRFVLNPRVRNEQLSSWRSLLVNHLTPAFRDSAVGDPELAADWVRKHIRVDEQANYYHVPLTPVGVWQLRVADALSRDLFFVALCRSLGIPARLDPLFEKPEYCPAGSHQWHGVCWELETFLPAKTAALFLSSQDRSILRPEYGTHFALARYQKKEYATLQLEGLSLQKSPVRLSVPEGEYLAITGNRQTDGSVLTRIKFFHLTPGCERSLPLSWRHAPVVQGSSAVLPAASRLLGDHGAEIDLNVLAHDRGLILVWLDPGREPSQHVLREWQDLSPLYENWGGAMIACVQESQRERLKAYRLPKQLQVLSDTENGLRRKIETSLGSVVLQEDPVLLLIDSDERIVMIHQGYQIGLGQRLLQHMTWIKTD
ncbi:transglutaminase domain-containing protein [bacterium]|nr:transglutaminase domain-containing protein [bacterium]